MADIPFKFAGNNITITEMEMMPATHIPAGKFATVDIDFSNASNSPVTITLKIGSTVFRTIQLNNVASGENNSSETGKVVVAGEAISFLLSAAVSVNYRVSGFVGDV